MKSDACHCASCTSSAQLGAALVCHSCTPTFQKWSTLLQLLFRPHKVVLGGFAYPTPFANRLDVPMKIVAQVRHIKKHVFRVLKNQTLQKRIYTVYCENKHAKTAIYTQKLYIYIKLSFKFKNSLITGALFFRPLVFL